MTIRTQPRAADVWRGIGGHFDSLTQVIAEFIDNSLANFQSNAQPQRNVAVKLEQDGEAVTVTIEDTGTGINDIESAMRIGDNTNQHSPLNEHGFGMKHALAAANPDNDDWEVITRTQTQLEDGKYTRISSAYDFEMEDEVRENAWPGMFNTTGTIIRFCCHNDFFNTLSRGIRGAPGFDASIPYLIEDLGFIYAGAIDDGHINITVTGGLKKHAAVAVVKPEWEGFYNPRQGTHRIDLGGGTVELRYSFGEMKKSDYKRYYRRSMTSSGLEVRLNGRVMENNLFKEIWDLEPHNSYNHFLAIVDIRSANREALPKTRTSKNGIRSGDSKMAALVRWIRQVHPEPEKKMSGAISERELVEDLAAMKSRHLTHATKRIEPDFAVYSHIEATVMADLYVFDGHDVSLYEAKKDNADAQDFYQLLMYWDGAVSDGLRPARAILLASTFSPAVDILIGDFNQRVDAEGLPYHFEKRTWKDEGVDYP